MDRLYAVFFYTIFAVLAKYDDVSSRHFYHSIKDC